MRNRDGRYNLMFEEWVTDGPFIISPRITFEVLSSGCVTVTFTASLFTSMPLRMMHLMSCTSGHTLEGSFAQQVSVRILGGLMALGYEIGTIMKRTSIVYSDDCLTIKLDDIEGMGRQFIQVPEHV